MNCMEEAKNKLEEASPPGVEPLEVKNKITNLEVHLLIFYSSVVYYHDVETE